MSVLPTLAICVYRLDGKRPGGASIIPGKVLVWDTTCPNTLAPSYTYLVTQKAGAVANKTGKKAKYAHLGASHYFLPVAVESLGVEELKHCLFCGTLVATLTTPFQSPLLGLDIGATEQHSLVNEA